MGVLLSEEQETEIMAGLKDILRRASTLNTAAYSPSKCGSDGS
jgi:hypothetical protein